MTSMLRDTLRQLADDVPEVRFPPDLYHRSRRAYRRRVAATAVAATAAVLLTGTVASRISGSRPGTVAAGGDRAETVYLTVDRWFIWVGLAVLAAFAVWWWLSGRRRAIAVAAATAAIALVIGSGPPGIAWWGEPSRTPGLPDQVVVPSMWTARATDSPPGRAAILFGGPATWGDFDAGRIAMVAGDGERYRVLDSLTYEDPGELSLLSPDGRYVSWGEGAIDLTTGRLVPGQPVGVIIAWSPDSSRYLYRTMSEGAGSSQVELGIWDLENGRGVSGPDVSESPLGEPWVAFSPDGTQYAVQERGQPELRIYRVGQGLPERTLVVGAARLGGPGAWAPDGRSIALTVFSECQRCPLPWYPSKWELKFVDPTSGEAVPGETYPAFTSVTHVRVMGWRSDHQPVVTVGDPGPRSGNTGYTADEMTTSPSQWATRVRVLVLNRSAPPEPLLTLPPGVEDIDIAADYLTTPVHPARPATFGPSTNPWLLGTLGCTAVVLLLLIGVISLVVRIFRRRRAARRVSAIVAN